MRVRHTNVTRRANARFSSPCPWPCSLPQLPRLWSLFRLRRPSTTRLLPQTVSAQMVSCSIGWKWNVATREASHEPTPLRCAKHVLVLVLSFSVCGVMLHTEYSTYHLQVTSAVLRSDNARFAAGHGWSSRNIPKRGNVHSVRTNKR